MYQVKSEDKQMVNSLEKGEVEAATETSNFKPISSQSSDTTCTTTSDNVRTMAPDVTSRITTNIRNDNAASTTSGTVLLATTSSVDVPYTVSASGNKVLLPTPTTANTITTTVCLHSSATPVTIPAVSTSTVSVITDSTSTVNVTKATTSVCDLQSNKTPSEECEGGVIKSTGNEPKIGQKRPATDTSSASAPKRTREVLRNNLQQLLEGKGSVSEDETTKTPSQSTNITGLEKLKYLLSVVANCLSYAV